MTTAATVRSHLVEALEADLIGPFDRAPGEATSDAKELLRNAPSRTYLTGFLVPKEQGEIDEPDADDELDSAEDDDDEAEARGENAVKKVRRLPASMGLSVFVPASVTSLTAHVAWADYLRIEVGDSKRWSRTLERRSVSVPLTGAGLHDGLPLEGSQGLVLKGRVERVGELLAVAVFLVNQRTPAAGATARDETYAFQCHLALEAPLPFHGRTDRSDETSEDPDERINDLQHRHRQEFAVGHGVGVRVAGPSRIETTWLPTTQVAPVVARKLEGVEVRMETLAALESPAAARAALGPMMNAYRAWLDTQAAVDAGSPLRNEVRDGLVQGGRRAAARMDAGLAVLEKNSQAFQAFRWMNAVMAQAERKARPSAEPAWRLFQLAFILLNLASVEDEAHPERELVELIFFPTGGGKTQAYLGLIAFTLLLRRLRGTSTPDGGLGVAVILRYTLRLLTLDQLGRASTLICALELLRKDNAAALGDVRFSIGLWVGASATANTLEQVSAQITEYRNNPSPSAQSPFPLAKCPWCGTDFVRDCFVLSPNKTNPTEVKVGCAGLQCPFNLGRNPEGVPVLFVDEAIYRELPCFLVATVDKFALLPWRGETGMLFGRVLGRTGGRFFGPCDDERERKAAKVKLPNGLRPPELIVQDELHLISGPLGSMVGLYEAAVLTLAPKAKLVASTATVRRSHEQVRRLYGRRVALFPPPGVEANETFFAHVGTEGARQYVGVGAPGRPLKTTLLQVYVALLAAAQKGQVDHGAVADAYLTLVGYFNSLRELGGMRRLVEDEVRRLVMRRFERKPEGFTGPSPWFAARTIRAEPVELTSREKTSAIKDAKDRLELPHGEPRSVDVVLASNMISVGVDIDRLGLMVVAGQPKTTAEYIQASSRVGRNAAKPGLVVTCFNLSRPRDRSHFERFDAYHGSFYRFVEATSVTPFSAPALDRGLAGVVVALGRLFDHTMTAPFEAMKLGQHRAAIEQQLERVVERAHEGLEPEEGQRLANHVRQRITSLLDSWQVVIKESLASGARRPYSNFDPAGRKERALLRQALEEEGSATPDELRFVAPTSMRDVEPSVHLWLTRQPLGGYKQPKRAEPELEAVKAAETETVNGDA
ncbi:MAG: helicase [Myxococcus sp.]|nr:helicase [Myxococcus sp.]